MSLYYGGFVLNQIIKILLAGVRQQGITGYDFIARLNSNALLILLFGTNGEVQHLPLTVNSIQMKMTAALFY